MQVQSDAGKMEKELSESLQELGVMQNEKQKMLRENSQLQDELEKSVKNCELMMERVDDLNSKIDDIISKSQE